MNTVLAGDRFHGQGPSCEHPGPTNTCAWPRPQYQPPLLQRDKSSVFGVLGPGASNTDSTMLCAIVRINPFHALGGGPF
ncbi:hypothetical protein DPEC_G00245540 [Dallia pectoralis]|uniref:Uncharacterized protein n=1 Tax=Dallia pectoralis TaxID=75939 RepID=A0ACC2FW06_DALPE|nr:hypothetical protein DPEC_G00245540 [Dallia pectoralis]